MGHGSTSLTTAAPPITWQILDELPMVWGNSAFVYICHVMHDKPGVSRWAGGGGGAAVLDADLEPQ